MRPALLLAAVLLTGIALTGCGRAGPLERPAAEQAS